MFSPFNEDLAEMEINWNEAKEITNDRTRSIQIVARKELEEPSQHLTKQLGCVKWISPTTAKNTKCNG